MCHYVNWCLLPHCSPNNSLNVRIMPQYLTYILYTFMWTISILSIHYTETTCFPVHQPLPFIAHLPGALASAIHNSSTFLWHAPLVQVVVVLPGASPSPLVATSPGAASSQTPLIWLVCPIAWHPTSLLYGWLSCCLLVMPLPPVHLRLLFVTALGVI